MARHMYHYWTSPWEMHLKDGYLANCIYNAGARLHLDEETSGEAMASMEGNR